MPFPHHDHLPAVRALALIAALLLSSSGLGAQPLWKSCQSGVTEDLNGVTFAPGGTAFVVGYGGIVLRSRDNGTTWERLDVGWQYEITAVAFTDDEHGFVMSGPWVIQTSDGGATWTTYRIIEGAMARINALQIINDHDFICAGVSNSDGHVDRGGVVRTTDGGLTWQDRSLGITAIVRAMHFSSPSTGIAVGYRGLIFRTVDSGATWNRIDSNAAVWYTGVHFPDSLHGFIVGTTGTTMETTDGGLSWRRRDVGIDTWLIGIDFLDRSTGTVVGPPGAISTTSDAGVTWHREESGTDAWLNAVAYGPNGTAIAVGRGGTILRRVAGTLSAEETGGMSDMTLSVGPNPLTGTGTIRYRTERQGRVELTVHGTDGRLIERLRSGVEEAGAHTAQWNVGGLAAGVYEIVLHANGRTLSRKCVVIR